MRTINRERGLEVKIKKMCLCLGVGFVGFILKQRKYLVHALCIEKDIVYQVISFREG